MLGLLSSDPVAFVILAASLVFSLTLHEFGHAWTADRLGDDTPRRMGRVTLNPAAHLDPFGTLLLLFAGFGFARPVPVNPNRVGRWGMLAVAAAGPIANILIALSCVLLLSVLRSSDVAVTVLLYLMSINIVLAVFNLLPIPLFDGSRIISAFFPRTLGRSLAEFEMMPFSFVVVMLFVFIAREPIGRVISYFQSLALSLL
ncbi:site-2 protease family protein [Deinococcus pimensis]|uniref:site-2 protease family protein n=1 Tax=Deinococcus pimensis TaxID=309888 RepID=UPI000486FD43|nr:site-2 protease family protein [Deinococcus pimensis]